MCLECQSHLTLDFLHEQREVAVPTGKTRFFNWSRLVLGKVRQTTRWRVMLRSKMLRWREWQKGRREKNKPRRPGEN